MPLGLLTHHRGHPPRLEPTDVETRSAAHESCFSTAFEFAADLARQHCDVFLAPGTEATLVAIKQASLDTPIVVVAVDYDPEATGHIASLARPGGRITGMTHIQSELPAKRVELLKRIVAERTEDRRPRRYLQHRPTRV